MASVACLHVVIVVCIVGYEMWKLTSASLQYAAAPEQPGTSMKAAQFSEFGNASVVKSVMIPRPECCAPGQLLVKVHTAAINPVDFKQRRMPAPAMMRPLPSVSGFDFSGVVERIGEGVAGFQEQDAVFGMLPLLGQRWGAFQEYVVVDSRIVARAPKSVPLEQAAALPLVGLTVLHALAPVLDHWRKTGEHSEGKRILVQAGAGGVGTFAIQYCKNVLGMHVATTASAAKTEIVEKLGAEQVIDYRAVRFEDVVRGQDVVLDTVTQDYEDRTLVSETVLKQEGKGHYVNVISTDWSPSARENNPLFMMLSLLRKWSYSLLARFGVGVYYHCDPVQPDGPGLAKIASLVDAGKIVPVIDRTYALDEAAAAHEYLEGGRAVGKVLVTVSSK